MLGYTVAIWEHFVTWMPKVRNFLNRRLMFLDFRPGHVIQLFGWEELSQILKTDPKLSGSILPKLFSTEVLTGGVPNAARKPPIVSITALDNNFNPRNTLNNKTIKYDQKRYF